MTIVSGEYPDYSKHENVSYFRLESDQEMNPFKWSPPINWKGRVNNIDVSFIQTSHSGASRYDYDFNGFPKELEGAISYIIKSIDAKMKIMD